MKPTLELHHLRIEMEGDGVDEAVGTFVDGGFGDVVDVGDGSEMPAVGHPPTVTIYANSWLLMRTGAKCTNSVSLSHVLVSTVIRYV